MAKGFTVKAKSPVAKKAPEWDYELARQLVRGRTFVFCLPGRGVSYNFLKSFVSLSFDLVQSGAAIQISQDYSSMVNFARCKCLGANVLRGPNQLPWDGKLKYDYQVWIDSDIVFNTEKFYQLILNAIPADAVEKEAVTEVMKNDKGEVVKNEDGSDATKFVGHRLKIDTTKERSIVAGWYCTEDGKTTSVAHWLDEEDFRTNGGVMNHETIDSISKRKKPFTVDYTGFGWLLIKNGVFENEQMTYPWFAPKMQIFESGEVQDMCGEDVSFCLDAKEAGFEIWCDPRIRVGHEKTRII
tara:strand:+ start:26 stop:919 length:894 start_codon:yes stop_codon:yes gene_type:complete